MSTTGYIQVRTFASQAQLPIQDAAITVTEPSGDLIALRLTNSSGQLARPIAISVPQRSAGMTPNTGVTPYASVDLYVRKDGYEEIYIKNLQIFADTVTLQPLQLIPFAEFPGKWNKAEQFYTTPQNL